MCFLNARSHLLPKALHSHHDSSSCLSHSVLLFQSLHHQRPLTISVAPHSRIDLRRRQLPLKYLFDPAMRPTPCRNSNGACLWNHTWSSNNSTCVIFMHHHLLTQQHPTVKGLNVFTTADLYSRGASSHCFLEGTVNSDNTARLTSKATGVKSNTARQVSKQLHTWCHRCLDSSQESVLGYIRNKSGAFVINV